MSLIHQSGWGTPARAKTAGLACALLVSVLAVTLPASGAAPPATPPGLGRLVENSTTGEIAGVFVSLFAPGADDVVRTYTSEGVVFLERVAVPGYALNDKVTAGPLLSVHGSIADAQAHDTPASLLKINLDANTSASFVFGPAVAAAAGPNGSVVLTAAAANRTAALWTTCPGGLTLSGGLDTATATAALPCEVVFRSRVNDPSAEALINSAAEEHRLGAEVSVAAHAAGGSDVATYGDANVIVTHTDGRVVVSVSSASSAPTAVLVRFIPPGAAGSSRVLVDGQPVSAASSLSDSLDPTAEDAEVEYSLTEAGGTAVLVVSLASPGSHVIEIESVAAPPAASAAPPIWIGVVLGAALAALATAALLRRR